jgi:uncharacterized repeat protein (TIGR03803 family)
VSLRRSSLASAAFVLILLLLLVGTSLAQTVNVLYNFDGTAGSNPLNITLTQGRDGQLYGTTVYGGTSNLGAIFKVTPSGHATALHSFNGTDGSYVWAGLTLGSDGNFYGTTLQGGTTGYGVLFRITPTGTLTVLHNFANNGIDGTLPVSSPILASDGNLYGATQNGGPSNAGTIYRFTPAGVLTTIYVLTRTSGSFSAFSPTQGSDGNLYVATLYGGSNDCGTLLQISTAGVLSKSYSFDCAANGANPSGSLFQGSDGNFYGATYNGGQYSMGVLFKLSPDFAYTVLHNFGATFTEGTNASGGVMQATDGNFYGLDYLGSNYGDGTIYNYSLSGTFNTLYDWTSNVGSQGQFSQHTNGTLYGVTYQGGTNNLGTVFSLTVGARPFVALVQYQGKRGSTAQILGQGFTGTTVVTFNGTPAASFTVVRDTYLTAVVPTGATSGPVVVTTTAGTLKSNKNFRVSH